MLLGLGSTFGILDQSVEGLRGPRSDAAVDCSMHAKEGDNVLEVAFDFCSNVHIPAAVDQILNVLNKRELVGHASLFATHSL